MARKMQCTITIQKAHQFHDWWAFSKLFSFQKKEQLYRLGGRMSLNWPGGLPESPLNIILHITTMNLHAVISTHGV